MSLKRISRKLCREVAELSFGAPVAYVYNPLDYARGPWELYLERFGNGTKSTVLVGMNPGPFGMAQTGVPFGDVKMVRDWMGITEPVGRPSREHPKRPIQGFDCPRSEVSGSRLWGWAESRFGTAQRFFERFFVLNYCPLVFLEDSGRNRTPDKLPAPERDALFSVCDRALAETIDALGAERVVGVGAFAQQRIRAAVSSPSVQIGRILHPSPASPAANRGWAEQAEAQLEALGAIIR